jgi:A/G-specific adenine glycosylase
MKSLTSTAPDQRGKPQRGKSRAAPARPQAAALLAWYDRHQRVLPWRAQPGERSDAYRVWLSETMLQQTTVKAVAPYYAKFLAKWPDLNALAAASLDEVLAAWAGLGYYARARNLHACARALVDRHGGQFPASESALRELPGIGAYTAAAIAAIAFDLPATPVDGNIERVIARLYAVTTPLPAGKAEIARHARALTPTKRAGDFAQALMDLGATICTPKTPACALCPWHAACVAQARGEAELFPLRTPKREGQLRRGAAFVAHRADDCVLLRTRPARGLLGGMTEVPTTAWAADFDDSTALLGAPCFHLPLPSAERPASADAVGGSRVRGTRRQNFSQSAPPRPDPLPSGEREIVWRRVPGVVRHVFTHFPLELTVYRTEVPGDTAAPAGTRWIAVAQLGAEALPSLMRKVVARGLRDESNSRQSPHYPSPLVGEGREWGF